MLVCPSCHSTNPDLNKFCQRCGNSLTEKTCPSCNYEHVPYEAEACPNCSQFTGQVWWVSIESVSIVTELKEPVSIVLQETESSIPESESSEMPPVDVMASQLEEETLQPPETNSSSDVTLVDIQPLADSQATVASNNLDLESEDTIPDINLENKPNLYLDPQQRYKFLETEPPNLKVLDLKPLQATVLSTLPNLNESSNAENIDFGEKNLNIPKIAIDYLKIQAQCPHSSIPLIHDAWQDGDRIILLLEDRSKWLLIHDLWSSPEVSTTKILSWMDQMIQLWIALETKGYRQSLLKIDNIKVDEDETVALQQLYAEPEGVKLELQDLGEMWHQLFGESAKTQFLSLSQMLKSLRAGEIETIVQLQAQLGNIYDELQANSMAGENHNLIDDNLITISEDEPEESDESPTVVLPKRLTAIEHAGLTHPGKQRPYNEDFFAIETNTKKIEYPHGESISAKGLYILCDGMGGHAGGEVASQMAVETIKNFFDTNWQDTLPEHQTINEAILAANQELYNLNQRNASSGTGRMGTTLVMLLVHDTKAAIAHVGDSRLYSITKQNGLQRLTVDHEVGQREIQRGVEEAIAYARPDAYQLTQALGPRDHNFIKPDIQFFDINQDTLLILGSDGLTDNDLLETYGVNHLLPLLSSTNNLDRGASKLIELANEYNGHDNITAVLVRVRAAS
jgi:protein phosphatase